MSDMLSQDEINALLGASEESEQFDGGDLDLEAVGEVVRVATEAGITSLSELLQAEIPVETEGVEVVSFDEFVTASGALTAIVAEMGGAVDGILVYAMPPEGAARLGTMMLGDAAELNPVGEAMEGFREAMEEASVHIAQALGAILGSGVNLSLSDPIELFQENIDTAPVPIGSDESVVHTSFRLSLGGEEHTLHALLPVDVAESVAASLGEQPEEPAPAPAIAQEPIEPAGARAASSALEAAERDEPEPAARRTGSLKEGSRAQVGQVSFRSLRSEAHRAEAANLDLLLDVPLQVTVELGRTRMQIRDILELGKGSVVELDKLAGEPVEIFVNGKLIAKGEVVTIDENFGVKITDIVSRQERVSNLG